MTGMFDDILGPDKDEDEVVFIELDELDLNELEKELEESLIEKLNEIKKSNRSWKPKKVLS